MSCHVTSCYVMAGHVTSKVAGRSHYQHFIVNRLFPHITLEPHYNTNVGVHKKSVLYQNSVIMRALYTGSISSGSQALTGCKGAWSGWRRVLSGIPQGSVLGPILFLMFIDDLDEGLTSGILKFADHSKIFRVVNGPEDRNALQEDLRRLSDWPETWQMKFNVDECKVMHLGLRNMHWNYSMGGRHLKEVTEEKDLGVIITNDLKVEAQCSAACVKANMMLGFDKEDACK